MLPGVWVRSELREERPDRRASERRRLVDPVEGTPDHGKAEIAALVAHAARRADRDGLGRATVALHEGVAGRFTQGDVDRRVAGAVGGPVRERAGIGTAVHDLA